MPKFEPKIRTKHTNYTTEAFRELVETSLEELVENTGTLETKDLASWLGELKRKIGHVSDRGAIDGADGEPVLRYCGGDL